MRSLAGGERGTGYREEREFSTRDYWGSRFVLAIVPQSDRLRYVESCGHDKVGVPTDFGLDLFIESGGPFEFSQLLFRELEIGGRRFGFIERAHGQDEIVKVSHYFS